MDIGIQHYFENTNIIFILISHVKINNCCSSKKFIQDEKCEHLKLIDQYSFILLTSLLQLQKTTIQGWSPLWHLRLKKWGQIWSLRLSKHIQIFGSQRSEVFIQTYIPKLYSPLHSELECEYEEGMFYGEGNPWEGYSVICITWLLSLVAFLGEEGKEIRMRMKIPPAFLPNASNMVINPQLYLTFLLSPPPQPQTELIYSTSESWHIKKIRNL